MTFSDIPPHKRRDFFIPQIRLNAQPISKNIVIINVMLLDNSV